MLCDWKFCSLISLEARHKIETNTVNNLQKEENTTEFHYLVLLMYIEKCAKIISAYVLIDTDSSKLEAGPSKMTLLIPFFNEYLIVCKIHNSFTILKFKINVIVQTSFLRCQLTV